MLIALEDDSVLRIYGTPDDTVRAVEALDAEATFRTVFDETGKRYAIHWVRKNERGLFTVGNGEYALVPDGTEDVAALVALISSATLIEPESFKPWLAALGVRLANQLRTTGASPDLSMYPRFTPIARPGTAQRLLDEERGESRTMRSDS